MPHSLLVDFSRARPPAQQLFCLLLLTPGRFPLLVFQRCPGREGSPNEVRHGSPADHVWPSAPHLHPPTVPPPRRPPRPPPWRSRLILQPASRPFHRRLPTGWSGLISRGPRWDSTQDPWETRPLLRTQFHWLLPTHRPARPPSRFRPRFLVLILRMMAPKQARIHVSSLTHEPTLALTQNLNCKQASHCCKAWSLTCVGTWMIFGFAWRFWMAKHHNSCIFSQHCRVPTTPQQKKLKQQELRHQYWHQLPHWGLRRMTHQARRRTCHQPSRRTPCSWTGHQSRRSRLLSGTRHSTPSSWMRGRITAPLRDMYRCLCYFSMCVNVVLPHECHLYQLLSMAITVKMVTFRDLNFGFS
jgi:hypothetical protein